MGPIRNPNIPWKNIAAILGPTITGSAVIQHLANLRIMRPPSTALALLLADTKVRGRKLMVIWSANVQPQLITLPKHISRANLG